MKIEISLLIALGGFLISIITVYVGIKKNTKVDVQEQAEKTANEKIIQFQLNELKDDVKKILKKLDEFDKDVDERIDKALQHHIDVYHKGE